MKTIISAFACLENRGSEHELGWKCLCEHASFGDEVHLITNAYVNANIVESIRDHSFDNVVLHFVDFPHNLYAIMTGIPGAGYQVAAYFWEFRMFFYLLRTFPRKHYDLGIKSTYGSYRWPSFLWYFAKEFHIDPVSGGGRFPLRFQSILSFKSRCRELWRALYQRISLCDPFVLLTMWKANVIHVGNAATRDVLPRFVRKKCQLKADFLAINPADFRIEEARHTVSVATDCLKLFYTGKLLEWKGVMLVLRALSELPSEVNYSFTIMGLGPAREYYSTYVQKHNLNVVFVEPSTVPRSDLSFYFFSHDLFVFPTLHGEAGFAPVEAKLHGMRLLTLDSSGLDSVLQSEDICIDTCKKQTEAVVASISQEIKNLYGQLKGRVIPT